MKLLLVASLTLASTASFAISTPKLIEACRKVGVEKVVDQAKAYGLKVNPKNVKECGVDNRPLNIASYVWFCATTEGGEKEISQLTQKPAFGKCF